jgi:protease I
MTQNLTGKRIAILATNGVEENSLVVSHQALVEAGANVWVIGLRHGTIQSVRNQRMGDKIAVSAPVGEVAESQFSALVLPGGLRSSDELRRDREAVAFVRSFFDTLKPVAAICEGAAMLLEAGVVHDRTLTSLPSLRQDLANAGAHWVDRDVAVDQGLVTSQNPADLDAFCRRIVAVFAQDWPGFDMDAALANPKQFFLTPEEVVALRYADDATKLALLSRWESDARALSAAEDEGMGGGEESNLREVRKAVHVIEPPTLADTGNPTKSGG